MRGLASGAAVTTGAGRLGRAGRFRPRARCGARAARLASLLIISAITATAVPAAQSAEAEETVAEHDAPSASRPAALSLQGGWWTLEAEWRTRVGLYAAVGVPWPLVPLSVMNGATWVAPLSARVGYDLALSPRWSLRASGLAATSAANETGKCGCTHGQVEWRTFLFAGVGVRYQSPGGLVLGAELPLIGGSALHQVFPPPMSLAFSQLYVGHSWGR